MVTPLADGLTVAEPTQATHDGLPVVARIVVTGDTIDPAAVLALTDGLTVWADAAGHDAEADALEVAQSWADERAGIPPEDR